MAPVSVPARFVREATVVFGPPTGMARTRISVSADVAAFVRPLCENRMQESFFVVALDQRQRTIAWSEVFRGTLAACPVAPSDVFRFAMLVGAAAIVVSHNHPSGDPAPSPEDIALTARLCEAGRVVGVKILDHVIVAGDGGETFSHFSFLDAGLMNGGA